MNYIEILESRIAPALVFPTVVKGVLTITHDNTSGAGEDLVVTQTGVDTFTVKDTLPAVDTDFGSFPSVKSIAVKYGSNNSTLDLKVSTDGLSGALNITTTGGTNTFDLSTVNGTSGRIVGKVNIIGASGNDTVNVSDGIAISSPVTFDGHSGSDSFYPSDAYLAKKLTLESVENITTATNKPVFIGGMLVENEDAGSGVVFDLNSFAVIGGKLTYCGSATVDDNVTIESQVTGPALLMLFGGRNNVSVAGTFASSLTITGGNGDDSIAFNSRQTNFTVGQEAYINPSIGGALTMKLGDGTNDVTLGGGAFFAKGLNLTTGVGDDTVNFTKFNALKNVTLTLGNGVNTLNGTTAALDNAYIAGVFKYTGGTGVDTLDINHLIAGTMNVKLGNGANGITGAGRVIGKSATILGGIGIDTLNFALASDAAALTVKLNAGDDKLTFLGGALAKVTLDGGIGSDTLVGALLLPAVKKITGFEV